MHHGAHHARVQLLHSSELNVQTGIDFLKSQLDDTLASHSALLQSMSDHEADADDQRFRDLCSRHLPHMREHQRMLESFRASLGSDATAVLPPSPMAIAGAVKRAAGTVFAAARSLADTPQSDYMRLMGDLGLARQLEVTFKTFRDAGRELRLDSLAHLGEMAERHHDDYSADAKRLVLQMFVERTDGAASVVRNMTDSRADSRMS